SRAVSESGGRREPDTGATSALVCRTQRRPEVGVEDAANVCSILARVRAPDQTFPSVGASPRPRYSEKPDSGGEDGKAEARLEQKQTNIVPVPSRGRGQEVRVASLVGPTRQVS